jgi:hypothetical protein
MAMSANCFRLKNIGLTFTAVFISLLGIIPENGLANDLNIHDMYVVGVIAEKTKSSDGIVVIKNHSNKKSYTLKGGDKVPETDSWVIESIKRRNVVVNNSNGKRVLPYGLKNLEGYVQHNEPSDSSGDSYAGTSDDEEWRSESEVDYVTEVYKSWIEKNKKSIAEFKAEQNLKKIMNKNRAQEGVITDYKPGELISSDGDVDILEADEEFEEAEEGDYLISESTDRGLANDRLYQRGGYQADENAPYQVGGSNDENLPYEAEYDESAEQEYLDELD